MTHPRRDADVKLQTSRWIPSNVCAYWTHLAGFLRTTCRLGFCTVYTFKGPRLLRLAISQTVKRAVFLGVVL